MIKGHLLRSRPPAKIIVVFSVVVFVIATLTMFFTGMVSALLFHLEVFGEPNIFLSISFLGVLSVILSTILARMMGAAILRPISAINEATKAVAKGDFSVRMKEDVPAEEIREMAHNFNIMAEELSHNEAFSNDFISNVSHEFNTPLSAIEGYATLLQNKHLEEEKRQMYVAKILFNVKRLSSLTGNILQLSRLENQQIMPDRTHYHLDEQLRETVLLFEDQWSAKNIDLDIDLENIVYYGSRDLLAQVWQNIFGNAVKFTPANGIIRVILRQEGDKIRVSIADNGPGMSPAVQERIFEKFYQGDNSHSGEGNGLGLTLAKRIVDLCGGQIVISSKEHKGTAFHIILPRDAEQ